MIKVGKTSREILAYVIPLLVIFLTYKFYFPTLRIFQKLWCFGDLNYHICDLPYWHEAIFLCIFSSVVTDIMIISISVIAPTYCRNRAILALFLGMTLHILGMGFAWISLNSFFGAVIFMTPIIIGLISLILIERSIDK